MKEELSFDIKRKPVNVKIVIGQDLDKDIIKLIIDENKKIAVITDSTIKRLFGDKLISGLKDAGISAELFSFPAGEGSKTRKTKEKIEDEMLSSGFGRDSMIVGIGGGVVGDMAGYAASTFMRGIPLLHIPTSLLAMIDSSIGGKTGVDTKHGKNLIGTFYQPIAVFMDLSFLKTLPDEEYLSGLAEIIKIAIVSDKSLYHFIDKYKNEILDRDPDAMMHMIKSSIKAKMSVVVQDEFETGKREVLNLGHTVGHAIELAKSYDIKHGYAVSIGMAAEAMISTKSGILEEHEKSAIINMLESLNLPTKIPKGIDPSKLIKMMELDKKARLGKPRFVLIESVGNPYSKDGTYAFEADEKIIKEALEACTE